MTNITTTSLFQTPPWTSFYTPVHLRPEYRLIFLDIETTGLDEETCKILEIACAITDKEVTRIDGPTGFNVVIHHEQSILDNMEPWCMSQHVELAKDSAASTISLGEAEKMVIDYLSNYIFDWSCVTLTGNNITFDRKFLKKYMPQLDSLFPPFPFDISSVRRGLRLWTSGFKPMRKTCKHRAIDDVAETIKEAREEYEFLSKLQQHQQQQQQQQHEQETAAAAKTIASEIAAESSQILRQIVQVSNLEHQPSFGFK